MILFFIPFALQGLLMGVDEFLHSKRGLGRWERWGHPLDTLTVLVPFLILANYSFSMEVLNVYVGLCLFSCLFITKDEFIHTKECEAFENWLHAVLFVLHPIIFFCAGYLWMTQSAPLFISLQPMIIGAFLVYQLLRWSIPWKQRSR